MAKVVEDITKEAEDMVSKELEATTSLVVEAQVMAKAKEAMACQVETAGQVDFKDRTTGKGAM